MSNTLLTRCPYCGKKISYPGAMLIKKKGEYYSDYIDRIISSNDVHTLNVKLSDLKHNMDITRIKNPTGTPVC